MDSTFYFAIDRGGTFTDVYAQCPGGKVRAFKLLSEDPRHYKDAPTEGIRRVMEQETGLKIPTAKDIDTSKIGWIRMGTTVATNALLERKGERMALAITKGFKELLHIGNQARPKIFDLEVVCPSVLYEDILEVEERVVPYQNGCFDYRPEKSIKKVLSSSNEPLLVLSEVNTSILEKDLKQILQKGITSLAVVLLHSYMYNEHEIIVKALAEKLGFEHVSVSSSVMPMVKVVPRGFTACADAYLTPRIRDYLQGFCSGFKDNLSDVNVLFMQSDGGLTRMESFNGSRAILSGPAGGVVGYAMTTFKHFEGQPVIGFDMGGTSTDVSRYAGEYEHVFESTSAGITIQAPQLDINTVAAGGGSRLFFRSGMFVVGPDSVGAHPGPVCYKKGGFLAITDANLALGRLLPQYFPKIFGKEENEPLDAEATFKAFEDLLQEINLHGTSEGKKSMTLEEVAMGFIQVANETMCRPIRALTQAKGHDTSRHILAVFGGAGGQHACAIARSLGMKKVFVHKYAGILSAYGMALADVVCEKQEPCASAYSKDNIPYLEERLGVLEKQCVALLVEQGFTRDDIHCESFLNLRYEATDCALMCRGTESTKALDGSTKYGNFKESFINRYMQEFGFCLRGRRILVDDIRVRGIGNFKIEDSTIFNSTSSRPVPEMSTKVYFAGGCRETSVYLLDQMSAGQDVSGPAIIMDELSTILVEPECKAFITKEKDVLIEIGQEKKNSLGTDLDTIQLSIFSHRFMSIAEQMGRILQRTSISTNIKERLDFSCALFGPDGGLVSNAPHIPVHLGAMQETVQYQLRTIGKSLKKGDVILSNHPTAGGSHLPDLTVITPVFYKGVPEPVFFVASRGHHADIGGITPGSMPPHSTSIFQEGAVFFSFKLVEEGEFQEQKLIDQLMAPGRIEGSSGSRNLQDNISDLRAQVAANQKGIQLVNELIDFYGLDVVQAYMAYIQESAEMAVRDLLKNVGQNVKKITGKSVLEAFDLMDDGSIIRLEVLIDVSKGTAIFDFSGTTFEVWGNCNAPKAVTVSAIIYCLRCMVGFDIPLNQGCLNPVKVLIPRGSLLDPSEEAAVVGGNVLTSQRVVDVILKAFDACAASQGCMNNTTFGDDSVGYYETVAGGAGAGPSWNGRSGIHTHMTNTRITDPEILEFRYPVVLNKFTLLPDTGGKGLFNGGDGIVREMIFRRPLTLSILTERRVFSPYGLKGGEDGRKGQNILIRKTGRTIRLPSKTTVDVDKGDMFRLESPGGGGYGTPLEDGESTKQIKSKPAIEFLRGSIFDYTRNQESS